uniref:Sensory neuron membrane protein n=1 Tax=Anoplophora chinensis TaxID=217632 RepID=A0A2H4ZBG9_ANOCN|nr:sensory neuron membrane protein [Anoplophora chinensis]
MSPVKRSSILSFIFPKAYLVRYVVDTIRRFYNLMVQSATKIKMKLPVKLGIGSSVLFVFIVLVGFVVFPKMITSKIKSMVNLKPGTEIRDMFLKIPFGLEFRVYIFNVTNPMEVQRGQAPSLKEVGPFCYEEWKEKVDVQDMEGDDTILYNAKDTFIQVMWPGCLSGTEVVTIPHPMILGMVNTVVIQKPGALTLVNKAIKSIYSNPASIFLTAKANDILFDGVIINCDVKDFAGKAICSQLKEAPTLRHVSENELAFALLAPKNATPGKRIKAARGVNNFKDVGRILEYDGVDKIDVWPTDECNAIRGTDGTIFPPLLSEEEGLVSFAPDLCRSLVAEFQQKTKYDGIPVRKYSATLGDMSKNEDEKCYCPTPETCLKKGIMDLYKCIGVPIYVSLPHFYETHESYLKGVKGLRPDKSKHEIIILFEGMTGGPVYAKKRLQFNMPLQANPKVDIFNNFTESVLPIFWVEEGVELNNTFTKPLKDLFKIQKIVKITTWTVLLGSLLGLSAAGYLFFKESGTADITPVHKVHPSDSRKTISTVSGNNLEGIDNHAMTKTDTD